ncbi:MAG: aldo/keto reductase [Alphaproteobacteria bacterium]|nr:aldo/keto reductase [Alphaproteobacteria bacterium]
MTITKWGIIGPGGIAHNFADGLKEATSGKLIAIGSRSAERRATFGDDYNIATDKRYATYKALVADPEIDAIYVSTPHPWHANLAILAMRAGKAVLVEKPAGMCAAEVITMTEIAAQENVFFMEAFMYRCHPQIARVLEIIKSGEIGEINHIKTHFGFHAAFDPETRLYKAALGGGGILDVGGYPSSLARLIAGAAIDEPFDNPTVVKGNGIIGQTGVDEVAYGLLKFASGFTAEIAVAIARNMDNRAIVYGTKGSIRIDDPWVPGRNAGPSDTTLEVTVEGNARTEQLRNKEHLFAFEAELVSKSIAQGLKQAPHPAPNHADSIGNNQLLDAWRKEIGYAAIGETPATIRQLNGVVPEGLPAMPKIKIDGIKNPISQLILGCDNRDTLADGTIIWDAWMEAGGNAFDTAFIYGNGQHEKLLGDWIKARGVADQVNIVAKGAHSPYCTPRTIATQLDISLERLGLDSVPIYIMHRDNPNVPVGEFIDALNKLHDAGKIGIFGGSNWSVKRFEEANDYAAKNNLQPMKILNNNLSLAVMERPVWDECISSNNVGTLNFLRNSDTMHLSWSSQARGFFLPENIRSKLPDESGPEQCFGSAANEERRKRAETIAAEHGVSTHNVATAWVLGQSFPSFALIGPRSPGEIVSTMAGVNLNLSTTDIAWLNLESDTRA